MFGSRGIDWHTLARYLHESFAAMAVLALACLFLDHWHARTAFPYPFAALAIAIILALGSALGRKSVRSMQQAAADCDVARLLDATRRSGDRGSDPEPRIGLLHPVSVMPPQIIVTAFTALYLVISIQQGGPPSASTQIPSPGAELSLQAQPSAELSRQAQADSRPVNPEWNTWPAIAAIALSELMYLGWMFEGEAASHELITISRRWSRRRSDLPQPPENVKTESDAAGLPAVPTAAPPVRRVQEICQLLERYGVNLIP
jgi:hypothetical protein